MDALKRALSNLPVVGPIARKVYNRAIRKPEPFTTSAAYWDDRYKAGRDSGAGSYSKLARFKADILNQFVEREGVSSVVEFGCGDGAQLGLAEYPTYLGIDVSPQAISICQGRYAQDPSKVFRLAGSADGPPRGDLAMSLDVIYHLVEDDVFETYMAGLFDAAARFVVVYSSNYDQVEPTPHVRHREFTRWVEQNRPDWALRRHIANIYPYDPAYPHKTSFADFYIFART